jgi:hypothetical protein
MNFQVVLYQLNQPDVKLVVARRGTQAECRAVMKEVAGRGWTMERRPDIHTFGELVLTFQREAA